MERPLDDLATSNLREDRAREGETSVGIPYAA
jgi:hypothetical protein